MISLIPYLSCGKSRRKMLSPEMPSYANWLPRWERAAPAACGDAIACTHRQSRCRDVNASGHELTAHQGDHRPALAVSQQAERTLVQADQPFDFGNAHVTDFA